LASKLKIISKHEAKARGLSRYFTGKPCKHGHIAERKTSQSNCIECAYVFDRLNKEKINEKQKVYYQKNKEEAKAYQKIYNKNNAKKVYLMKKAYAIKNKEKLNTAIRKRKKERYREDLQYRSQRILRDTMRKLIAKGKMTKPSTSLTKFATDIMGLSQGKLIKYIEKQFYPHPKTGEKMSWKNHTIDGWHIDHIKPVNSFDLTKLTEQKKCFHYTNLQPLWAEENLAKGDKY